MEKITYPNLSNKQQISEPKSKKIVTHLNESLIIKCQNFLKSKHLGRDYTYLNLSDLIRKSLSAYQSKQLNLTIPRPSCEGSKKTVGIVVPEELWKYYRSLPERYRTDILESCLVNYLNTI